MKKIIFTVALFLFMIPSIVAQNLQTGIALYEEGDYERALKVFENYDHPTANLFAGKSYFALNNYLKAKHYLNQVEQSQNVEYWEAVYTLGLTEFQLKNFGTSFDLLFEAKEQKESPSVGRSAYNFYRDLLDYVTLEQRYEAFKATQYDRVRLDLVESAVGLIDHNSAKAIFEAFEQTVTTIDSTEYSSIKALVSDSAAYTRQYNPNRYVRAPQGIAYNIGVALPQFDVEAPEYEITQQLYFGIQLAIERYNSEHADKKAFLSYKNTDTNVNEAAYVANDLVWNQNVDAIIGPLFSEVAAELSNFAELYEVPLLTPLANSDQLNLDKNYTFQLNPTFAVQGKKMAQHAINTLGYDTLAVIAEHGSLGEASAVAFLDESRKLGAEVVRYYVEELASKGYDISEYVKYFDPEVDTVFNYNIDAVYAPFTGTIAETLIQSLLTNLEAMQSEMTILGSEEWESIRLERRRLPNTSVYYTKTFEEDSLMANTDNFQSDFRLRFEMEPNRFAYIGYDAANVVLETLNRVQNPAYLKEGLKNLSNYRGIITNVSFSNSHINQEVKIKRLSQEVE